MVRKGEGWKARRKSPPADTLPQSCAGGREEPVRKKTHPLALAANTLLRTHIHPLPSNPLNPNYPQHALRVTHTPFIHSQATGHSYTHSWAMPTAHTA